MPIFANTFYLPSPFYEYNMAVVRLVKRAERNIYMMEFSLPENVIFA
jgi:hypothetical protein